MSRHRKGPANTVRQAVNAVREFFEAPYQQATDPADHFDERPDGTILAIGDTSIAKALQRFCEAGGTAPPAVISSTQLAGRYGATVFVGDNVLGVLFVRGVARAQIVGILELSGFFRVVDQAHDEWCWMP